MAELFCNYFEKNTVNFRREFSFPQGARISPKKFGAIFDRKKAARTTAFFRAAAKKSGRFSAIMQCIINRNFMRLFFVLCAAMLAFPAAATSHLSKDPQVLQARRLIEQGHPAEALQILRPLIDLAGPDITDIRFLTGLAAMRAAETSGDKKHKEALLDEAISAFRAILINRPTLVRVRLELARCFFLKEEDDLAKENFELALGSNPPPAMALNIHRFLYKIRTRKRWSGNFSINVAQNDNINSGLNQSEILINDPFFPFPRRFNVDTARTEQGLVFSGGREYQYPLNKEWRWRFGADATRGEYPGRSFDQTNIAINTGPRWQDSKLSEMSLQFRGNRRWIAANLHENAWGADFNARRQISDKFSMSGNLSWDKSQNFRNNREISESASYSIGGVYNFLPLLQGTAGFGGNKPLQSSDASRERNARIGFTFILPKGWTASANARWSRTRYERNVSFSTANIKRIDRSRTFRFYVLNRGITFFGFSPQLIYRTQRQSSNSVRFDGIHRNTWDINFVRQF